MGKLILENIIIEKSNKDINTGVSYNLTENFNLLCGDNEAGKSSLMKFIKEGFFKTKGVDTGKIYFKINNNDTENCYRLDIKDHKSPDSRCTIYDSKNMQCNYSIIQNNINQTYFEQGFTINLDDLMSIQNKTTDNFINIIKDPSGEKLNSYINDKKAQIKKILGDNNRLTKDTLSIYEKISSINTQINEVSSMESEYNNAINLIKTITNEIDTLIKEEEQLNIISEIKGLNEQLNIKQQEKQQLLVNYNEKLYNNQQDYIKIIQDSGKYDLNLNLIEKKFSKYNDINTKILNNLKSLKEGFSFNFTEDVIKNLTIDLDSVKNIKYLEEKKINLEKENISYITSKENTEEIIQKLESELKEQNTKETLNIQKLKDSYKLIDEGLKQYNFLINKITSKKTENTINLSNNKILTVNIVLGCLFVFSIFSAIYGFSQKINVMSFSSIITSLLMLIVIVFLNRSNKNSDENNRYEELKNNTLENIIKIAKDYDRTIENTEISYLPVKIESLKQEINIKIQNYENIIQQISKVNSEIKLNQDKLNNIISSINTLSDNLKNINNEIYQIIKNNNPTLDIPAEKYIDFIQKAQDIQNTIYEKEKLLKEIEQTEEENKNIIDTYNDFIISNNINIPLSSDYKENLDTLKLFYENNTNIKKQIDLADININSINDSLNKYNTSEFRNDNLVDIKTRIDEIKEEKNNKLNEKKEAEFRKRELEKFEGLNELKIRKNLLYKEFQEKIIQLIKKKTLIKLIETSKRNFDKLQPDLNNAQKYLSILTNNKYTKINLDLQEISNEDNTKTKKWNELSRGTKEQLYLALKLGYASNYTKDKATLEPNGKVNLPFIIDDAFVNFDKTRTKNALKCLLEFSKTNQVLYFTCHHDTIKEELNRLNSDNNFNVIDM